jgi:hypothetical protein
VSRPFLFSLLFIMGCARPSEVNSPVEFYISFVSGVQRGEYSQAFQKLTKQTQAALNKKAEELSKASGNAIKADGALTFFSAGAAPEPLAEVKLVSTEGDRAKLQATAGGKTAEVLLVKESGNWKIDLSESVGKNE